MTASDPKRTFDSSFEKGKSMKKIVTLIFIFSLALVVSTAESIASSTNASLDVSTKSTPSKDVSGWGDIHLNMKREDLVKSFGDKLVPFSKEFSAHYKIRDVQFGPIKVDIWIIFFHTGDNDAHDRVAQISANYQGPLDKRITEKISNYCNQLYGKGEAPVDGFSVQGNYKKRTIWRFPSTTIGLTVFHGVDIGKTEVVIKYKETISERHTVVVKKEWLDELQKGDRLIVIAWNKTPVFILRRTSKEIEFVNSGVSKKYLGDPESLAEPWRMQLILAEQYPLDFNSDEVHRQLRSIKNEYGVYIASGPHSGCIPVFFTGEARSSKGYMSDKEGIAINKWGKGWMSGFYDPCNDDYFDISGRMYKGDHYSSNLSVPKHRYDDKGNLIIGY